MTVAKKPVVASPSPPTREQLIALELQKQKTLRRMIAARKSRDSLLEFTKFTMPDPVDMDDVQLSMFETAWHHEAICQLLEKVERGEILRAIITMPPRHGKSELCSRRFPAWFVGRDPYRQTIFATYGADFAEDFGRKGREIIEMPQYRQIFPRVSLKAKSKAADRMETEAGGMMVWLGVGGPATGRGADLLLIDDPCVARGQRVRTSRGLVPIESVVVGDTVLTHKNRWRKVINVFDNGVREVVELSTAAHNVILTPEHNVYTSDGWVEARHAKDVYAECLSSMWRGIQSAPERAEVLQLYVPRERAAFAAQKLPILQGAISAAQGYGAKILRRVLRDGEQAYATTQAVHRLSRDVHGAELPREVLHSEVPPFYVAKGKERTARSFAARYEGQAGSRISRDDRPPMRFLRAAIQAGARLSAILLDGMQKLGAFATHEKSWQLQFSAWGGSGLLSPGIQAFDLPRGSCPIREVHGMRDNGSPSGASHGRRQDQRRANESGVSMPLVPYKVAQVEGRGVARVYDLEVEEDHSFVAEGVVVHNCKNREEAESLTQRNKTWDWFTSVAYTRLMPAGRIVTVLTRWHEDDLVGRIFNPDYVDPIEAKKWYRLDLPAIIDENTEDERALWPERYPLEVLKSTRAFIGERDWNALYQQRPTPPEGAFFRQEMIYTYGADEMPKNFRPYMTGDLALGEKKSNDETCVGKWMLDENDTLYLHPDLYWDRKSADASVERIIDMMTDFAPMATWWEKGQIDRAVGPFFRKRMMERKVYSWLTALPVKGDKAFRASSIRGRMALGRVKFPRHASWWPRAKEQLLKFTGKDGDPDDFVDMCSLIGQALGSQIKASTPASPHGNVVPITGTLGWIKYDSDYRKREKKRLEARKGF